MWSKVGSDINYTAGKVGIGTANPNKDLHVYNTTTNAEIDLQSTATAGSHWGIYHNSPDQSLRFWHSGVTDAMTILPSGNVGIGTADPVSFKLHVDDVLGQMQLKSTTGTNRANYRLKNTGGDVLFGIDSSIGGQISIGSSVYSAVINHAGNYPMQFGTNNTVRMTISNDGNVGIGTVSPPNRLSIQQSANATSSSASTYGFSLFNGTTDVFTLGYDNSYSYLQSWNTLPLQINSQGNNTLINALGAGNV